MGQLFFDEYDEHKLTAVNPRIRRRPVLGRASTVSRGNGIMGNNRIRLMISDNNK